MAGGPIGKLRDGDEVEIVLDRVNLTGSVNVVGEGVLEERPLHPDLRPHPQLPDDTRLWAVLQAVSGGTWGGAVYDVDRIIALLEVGLRAEEGGIS